MHKPKTTRILQAGTGHVLTPAAEVANSFFTRLVGLLGRKRLLPTEALWIVPTSGVHTIGMRFPIDVVLLDRNYQIVHLRSDMHGLQFAGMCGKVHSALELPAGRIADFGLQVGEILLMR